MFSHKKKVLAIAGAAANLLFSVAVAGVATFAWFCENDMVYSNGMNIQSNDSGINVENYTILKYDDDLKKGVAYPNSTDEFFLPDYDEYIKARNVYSNIIIKVDLRYSSGLNTATEALEIDIKKLASSTLKDADGIRELTSNVAQFKYITTSYTVKDTHTVVSTGVGISEIQGEYRDAEDAMYRTATTYFASRKTPSTFISLMNGQPVDPDNGKTITIVPELLNVGTIEAATVYIECSYNEQLATGFVADHPNESIHNLAGDITDMLFIIRPYDSTEYGIHNTGKYLKMTDDGRSYDGKYLASYNADDNESVLDGSKTTGNETIGSSSGINTNNNNYAVGTYMADNKESIYASDRIDDSSLTFARRSGTYQSENGHYIGNNTSTAGIVSSSDSTNLGNSLAYNNGNAVVKSTVNTNMQLKYDTTNSKYAYYNNTNSDISLYRYHENDMIDATLSSLQVTGPTGSAAQYSVGEYFSLRGVACIATYARGNTTFTINVNSMCTYTSSPEGTLEPEKSIFSVSNQHKTINVTYTDRGVTKTGSFELSIIEDVIEYIEIASPATHTTYVKGDTFDITGLVVNGVFTVNGLVDVTSECTFTINNTTYTPGSTLNISGDNLYVYIHYSGNATLGNSYQDRRYTISIKEYVCQIDEENENILLNQSLALSLTYNSTVVWEITGTAGAVSFSSSEVVTTYTSTYTGSNWANQTADVTVYGLAGGQCTVTAKIQGRESVKDTCIVRVIDGSNLFATYVVESKSAVTTTGLPPQYSTADYSSTYNTKYQLTNGNSMTLTLHGYTGYKITGITMSMHSNQSGGAGNFSATAGGSTIASISTAAFNTASWNDSYTTSWVDISPTITLQKAIRQGQDVVITIAATANSLFCQSFTITYEAATDAYATSLTVLDPSSNEIQNNATITLNSGAVGDTYLPTANVTYSDSSSNHDVTWSKTGTGNATLNAQNGLITFNSTSGSITVTVTTNVLDVNDQAISKSFTITWSNFTRELTSISVTGYTEEFDVDDQFTFGGTVTAHYNDNSEQVIASGYSVDTSEVDMSTAGTYTVTVSYTENNVTKSVEYTITVNDGSVTTQTVTIDFRDGGNCTSTSGNFTYLDFASVQNSANAPAYNSGSHELRLYANTSQTGNGNSVTLTPISGYKITSVVITASSASYTPTVKYKSDNGNQVTGSWSNLTMTMSNLNASSVFEFQNANIENVQLRLKTIVVTLVSTGGVVPPVKTLDSISLSGTQATSFVVGDTFTSAGLVVTAHYSDESTADVSNSNALVISGYDMSATGTQTVTVSYTENEVTKSATYTITVRAKVLDSITISGQTTTFTQGGTFSFGGTVTAHYEGTTQTQNVTNSCTFTGYNLNNLGEQTVTVSYTEGNATKQTTYTINVTAEQSTTTADITVESYATTHSWSNGTKYTTLAVDANITATVTGGGNTGKYYTSGNEWRIYQTENPTITITAANNKTIESVQIYYNVSNTGVLLNGETQVSSGTVVAVNGTSITFNVGNTGNATNGQVKITRIVVIYS